jgi:hypothetical protein
MIYFFLDKHGYRINNSYNNLTKLKNFKNSIIFFISGKALLVIEPLLKLISGYKKNFVLIYTDDQFGHRLSVNRVWWNSPDEVPEKLNHCNNFFMLDFLLDNHYRKIQPYPLFIEEAKPAKKIVYISEWKDDGGKYIEELWGINKNNILERFYQRDFYIYQNLSEDQLFSVYTGLSNKVRGYYCTRLSNDFPKEFVLCGKDWTNSIKSDKNFRDYNSKSRKEIYKGAICVDFLSRAGISVLYQRSIEIIESGGLLLQSYGYDSEQMYGTEICQKMCFKSYDELKKLICFYLNDADAFEETLELIRSHFDDVEDRLYRDFFSQIN